VSAAAAHVEPYLRVDGTKIWSLTQLERHLHPDADGRLAAGEQVARMYQEPGLAWLERQAQTAEELITERRNQGQHVD
jgi:hypothetical protein